MTSNPSITITTRHSPGLRVQYALEATGFFALMVFFRILGVDLASAIGGFLGRTVFYRTRLTQRAWDNLAAAYPEKSEAEIERIVREMWDNLGRTVAEYAHLDKFSSTGAHPRIE